MYFRRYDLGGKDSVDATAFAYAEMKKPITEYDRLVSKSPEELAEWLAERSTSPNCTGKCHKDYEVYGELRTFCHGCWLDYLKQEATNDP